MNGPTSSLNQTLQSFFREHGRKVKAVVFYTKFREVHPALLKTAMWGMHITKRGQFITYSGPLEATHSRGDEKTHAVARAANAPGDAQKEMDR